LCTAGTDGTVRMWDLKKSVIVKEFKDHIDTITSLVFSEGDRFLATGSQSGDIVLYNIDTHQFSGKLRPQSTQGIQSLNYSIQKPHLLASGGEDGSVHVWDTTRSRIVCSFHEHKAPCVSVQWTNLNDVLLISAGLDKKIFLYDIEEKKYVNTIAGIVLTQTHVTEWLKRLEHHIQYVHSQFMKMEQFSQ
jgi:protein NEDD1